MSTCKDCLHDAVCEDHCENQHMEGCSICMIGVCHYAEKAEKCPFFADKSRFVELPCKIGDTVWCIRNFHGHKHPQVGIVSEMSFTKDMELQIVVKYVGRGHWGEKIFPTREAAEEALKEETDAETV